MQGELIYPEEKIRNHVLYAWRVAAKLISLALFGIGSALLSVAILPMLRIVHRSRGSFSRRARTVVSAMFGLLMAIARILGVARLSVFDTNRVRVRKKRESPLAKLSSCVVIANHPSLLDVAAIVSQIPNADIIVNSYLNNSILRRIVRSLYILNDVPPEELLSRCTKSIADGNVLVVFPEGTRSRATGQNKFKKGAARISLAAKCPVVPIYIGGNNKVGLRKHDSLFLCNPNSCYTYNLFVKDEIAPEPFAALPEPIAAKRLNETFKAALADENNKENRI